MATNELTGEWVMQNREGDSHSIDEQKSQCFSRLIFSQAALDIKTGLAGQKANNLIY